MLKIVSKIKVTDTAALCAHLCFEDMSMACTVDGLHTICASVATAVSSAGRFPMQPAAAVHAVLCCISIVRRCACWCQMELPFRKVIHRSYKLCRRGTLQASAIAKCAVLPQAKEPFCCYVVLPMFPEVSSGYADAEILRPCSF